MKEKDLIELFEKKFYCMELKKDIYGNYDCYTTRNLFESFRSGYNTGWSEGYDDGYDVGKYNT